MTSNQEVSDAIVEMVVHRRVRRQPGAIAEIRATASQQPIEPVTDFGPGADFAGDQDVADPGLEPQHALLRAARSSTKPRGHDRCGLGLNLMPLQLSIKSL